MDPTAQRALDGATIALASYRIAKLISSDTVWAATRIKTKNWLRTKGVVSGAVIDQRELGGRGTSKTPGAGALVYPRNRDAGQGGWPWPANVCAGKAAEILDCQLCAGVWVTSALLVGWRFGGPKARTAIRATAIVGVQSLLSSR